MCGEVSVPVTRSTSVVPNRGANAFWIMLEASSAGEGEPPFASWQKIMMAPDRKFSCWSIPISRILEQSNPGGTSALMDFAVISFSSCACAENPPKPSSARKTPIEQKTKLIKTRGLKKADCEADFFFMIGYDVDGSLIT